MLKLRVEARDDDAYCKRRVSLRELFLKASYSLADNTEHKVFLDQINEDERVAASKAIPKESVPEVTLPSNQNTATRQSPPLPE